MQAIGQWTAQPGNSQAHKTVYGQAVLLGTMMSNLRQVYHWAHMAVVGAADGPRNTHSIQKSRTALASGRNSSDGMKYVNRDTEVAVKGMRQGKVRRFIARPCPVT